MTDELTRRVADALAQSSGKSADDLESEVIASTLIGAMMTASRHRHAQGYRLRLTDELERALSIVEQGFGPSPTQ